MNLRALVLGSSTAGFALVLAFHSLQSPLQAVTPLRPPPSSTTTTPGAPTSTTTAPPPGPRSAVGASQSYGFGTVSARVTVNNGRIVAVTTQILQTAESYSQGLANQVIPILQHEVIASQSANVAGLSGATFTTEAYLQSIQSALNQLHFP